MGLYHVSIMVGTLNSSHTLLKELSLLSLCLKRGTVKRSDRSRGKNAIFILVNLPEPLLPEYVLCKKAACRYNRNLFTAFHFRVDALCNGIIQLPLVTPLRPINLN